VGAFPSASRVPNPFIPHRLWMTTRLWGLAIAGALLAFGLTGRAPALAAEHVHSQRPQAPPVAHVHPPAPPPGSPQPAPLPNRQPPPPGHAQPLLPGHAKSLPPGHAHLLLPGHAQPLPPPAGTASPLRPGAVPSARAHPGMPTMSVRALTFRRQSQSFGLLPLGFAQQGGAATLEPTLESSEFAWGGCPRRVPGGTVTSRASAAVVFLAGLDQRVQPPASAGRFLPTDEHWNAIAWALRLDRPG
jgi:hypothetical protein